MGWLRCLLILNWIWRTDFFSFWKKRDYIFGCFWNYIKLIIFCFVIGKSTLIDESTYSLYYVLWLKNQLWLIRSFQIFSMFCIPLWFYFMTFFQFFEVMNKEIIFLGVSEITLNCLYSVIWLKNQLWLIRSLEIFNMFCIPLWFYFITFLIFLKL